MEEKNKPESNSRFNKFKPALMWLLIIGIFFLVIMYTTGRNRGVKEIETSEFIAKIESKEITKVRIQGTGYSDAGHVEGETAKKEVSYKCFVSSGVRDMKLLLKEKGIAFNETPMSDTTLTSLLPFLLIFVLVFYFMNKRSKQVSSIMGQQNEFGKSKASKYEKSDKTFGDVAGIDEAVEEVSDLVGYLKNPEKFATLGGRMPKGVLLTGDPGTGKTLLAKAIAGEAGVPFFSVSGSEFVEMFVGVGAARVRDLFENARKNSPCIVFIDEIDAVGRRRSAGHGHNNDEREQTLNQILVALDGFESTDGVIVLAATNRQDTLDPGLIRPGRFDRQVDVPMPDVRGREAIFGVHTRKLKLADGIDLGRLAKKAARMSGAAIEEVCNEAALLAAKREMTEITAETFDAAIEKVQLGAERRGMAVHEEDLRIVAYHEAGHAVVGHFSPKCDPVDKVTIIPRGQALGLTYHLPEEARVLKTKGRLLSDIVSLLGGRAAEHLLDDITVGAGNDLERATEIAKLMVCRFAMADLPERTYGPGHSASAYQFVEQSRDYSEDTAKKIDKEISRIIRMCMQEAQKIIKEHRDELETLAKVLLDEETVDSKRIIEILGPRPTEN